MRNTLFAASLLLLAACASTPKLPEGQTIGQTMEAREPVRFAVVDATPPKFFNQTVLVEAKVIAVCKKKGCWMQIEDGGKKAMVRWESGCGGAFKFPEEAIGKTVLIQGSFYPKSITQDDVEHLQEEAGGKVEIAREGYEFNASSVLIVG